MPRKQEWEIEIEREIAREKILLDRQQAEIKNYKTAKKLLFFSDRGNNVLANLSGIEAGIDYFVRNIGGFLRIVMNAIPWLATISLIFHCLTKATMATFASHEGKYTRAVKITTACIALSVGIITLIFTQLALPLILASAISDTLEGAWDIVTTVKNRFFGKWKQERSEFKKDTKDFYQRLSRNPHLIKTIDEHRRHGKANHLTFEEQEIIELDRRLTQKSNSERNHRGALVDNIHGCIINSVTVIGVILLFTPAAPVGAGILIGTACYGFLDKLHLNPFKWLAKKIIDNPFEEKTHHASIENIQSTIQKKHVFYKKLSEVKRPLLEYDDELIEEGSINTDKNLQDPIPVFNSKKILQGIAMAPKQSTQQDTLLSKKSDPPNRYLQRFTNGTSSQLFSIAYQKKKQTSISDCPSYHSLRSSK